MICRRHIVPALMEIVHKMRRTDINYTDAEWRYIATHEAGHAAVCEILNPGHTALISILSQGDSVAGKTAYASWGYSTEQELVDLVTVSLAGKAAVEVLLGEMDVGSAQDIQSAVKLLTMWYVDCAGGGFSAVENEDKRTSESGLQGQERLIAIKLEELYQRAKRIVFDNRELVSALSDAMLQDDTGTLLSSDIAKIRNSLDHG